MPIEIRHGAPGSEAAGQIIAQAGLANLTRQFQAAQQAQQLQAQREAQLTGIGAREGEQQAEMEYRAAAQEQATGVRREDLRFGAEARQEDIRLRAELGQQGAEWEEERRREEEAWVWEFTPQQKHEMTKNRNSRQMVVTQMHTGEMDYPTGTGAIRQLDVEYASYTKQKRPRNSSDGPQFEQGREPGKLWPHPKYGGLYTTDPATGMPKVIVRPDQMPQAIEAKQKFERERAELEREQKREDRILAMREKLELLQVDRLGEHGEKIGTGFLEPDKMEEKLTRIYRELDKGKPSPDPWWVKLRKEGIDVYKIDRELPDQIGYAQAWLRYMKGRYGGYDGIPLYKRAAWEEMSRIYEDHINKIGQEGI